LAFKIYNFNFVKDLPQSFVIDASGMTIAEMFDYLETEYGSKIKDTALENAELGERTRITVAGKPVYDIKEVIPDDSNVMISFMLAGG
jgi:hypothetical protein